MIEQSILKDLYLLIVVGHHIDSSVFDISLFYLNSAPDFVVQVKNVCSSLHLAVCCNDY